jgi:hypothetical protein
MLVRVEAPETNPTSTPGADIQRLESRKIIELSGNDVKSLPGA